MLVEERTYVLHTGPRKTTTDSRKNAPGNATLKEAQIVLSN